MRSEKTFRHFGKIKMERSTKPVKTQKKKETKQSDEVINRLKYLGEQFVEDQGKNKKSATV